MQTLFPGSLASISWLINYTKDVSILICLIFVIKLIAAKRLPAWWSYSLWLILLIRMAILWQFENRLNILTFIVPTSVNKGIFELVIPAKEIASSNMELNPTTAITAIPNGWNLPLDESLLVLWIAGAVGFGIYILIRNIRFWFMIKRSAVSDNKNTLDLLEECKNRLNIHKEVDVIITDYIRSPALFGYFHPRLLLPQGILEYFTHEKLVYVFMHEMGHLKRHDIAVSCLTTLFQIIHWFNPLVWLAFYQMRIDQESACDATVLTRLRHHQPVEYATAIVAFLERYCQNRQLPSMAGILENKTQMKRRLAMIVNYRKYSKRTTVMAAALLITMGFIFYTLTGFAAGSNETSDVKLPESNKVIISIPKDGPVFFNMDGAAYLRSVGEKLSDKYKLGLTEKELANFSHQTMFGIPLSGMKQFLELTDTQRKNIIKPGIPIETGKNELHDWLAYAIAANPDARLFLKVDNTTPYPIVKKVMDTLQDCGLYRFSLVMPDKVLAASKEPHIMELILPGQKGVSYVPPQVVKIKLPEKGSLSAAPPIAKDQGNMNNNTSMSTPVIEDEGPRKAVVDVKPLLPVQEAPTVNEAHALSIVLSGHNKIYWYIGLTNPKVYATDYSETGIRKVLQDQNKLDDKLVVLIKPDQNSTYENLVDILNEMSVSDVQRYVLADLEDDDKVIIQKYLIGSNR